MYNFTEKKMINGFHLARPSVTSATVFARLSPPPEDWYEQLHPLILTLKDCMGEVVNRAKQSLTFVLLQELACSLPQCLVLTLRRDIVFSQAVGASWAACEHGTGRGCSLLSLVRTDVFRGQCAF